MTGDTLPLDERLQAYLRTVSLREPGVLRRLREATQALPEASMQIAPEQGQLLQLLVRLLGARQALEIGTFTGYSAGWIALALPAEGSRLVCCDRSREWAATAAGYWRELGVEERIELRLGEAQATLDTLVEERARFDFAFIDADKAAYEGYYESCLKLVRSGGLIAIDNTLWYGRPADPAVEDEDTVAIRHFNATLLADDRIDLSLVPVGDGLTLARKR
ncbi:MAG TPA: class I SAM-dependent methyltransferase [Gammaproteobacteria bacterium]